MQHKHEAPLELAIQEMEAQDAPGFWTVSGAVTGVSLVTAVAYT
jgi:hypothetical protein